MRSVNLILKEEVPGLGDPGELVKVKVGYARNFLLPQGKAVLATESKVKQLEHNKRLVAEKLAKELKDLEAVRDRLQSLDLEVVAKAGEEGKLFGSVTSAQITDLLVEKGFEIDRRKVLLADPIKELGEHVVSLRLRKDVVAELKLKVSPEEAPAAAE
jgi:large subunit ribosomal protein L9